MTPTPVCAAPHLALGQDVACAEPPLHRGPHCGPGTDGVVAVVWCDLPCQGRWCRGPCHAGDPGG